MDENTKQCSVQSMAMSENSERVQHAQSAQNQAKRVLDIVSLYPNDMNIYGDWGNVLTLLRRAESYGYTPVLHEINQGDAWPEHVDLIVGGGGQDTGQSRIMDDLHARAAQIRKYAEDGVPMLMICGLYQLFGDFFETSTGERIAGIGVFPAQTYGKDLRLIGNITVHSNDFGDVVGYENHSGQTFLGQGVLPLGTVDREQMGNNAEDLQEGARYRNVIGTYLHGSILPKNPRVADFFLRQAAVHRYGEFVDYSSAEGRAYREYLDQTAERARKVAMSRPR